MRARPNVALLVTLAMAGAACATTTNLTAVWKDPAAGPIRFERVIVAFQHRDQAVRRSMEDEMAKRIARATPGYTVLTPGETRVVDVAKAKISSAGFDGAVVARYVNVETQTTYVPGTTYWGARPYGTMWGYWGYGYGAVYDPGYMVNDTIATLEANVYSVKDDKLVWASQSETFNPTSGPDLMKSVIAATVARMRKEGVVQ